MRLAALAAVLAVRPLPALATGEPTLTHGSPWEICATAASRAERAAGLPAQMLHAVSLAESGRWHDVRQATVAWPWTVNAGGTGKFFPTKAEAIAHVRRLQADGRRNIDVGCMQVNLHYHGEAFDRLEEAFDPSANTGYAARFLADLLAESRSWALALARYHSRNRKPGTAYMQKVFKLWNAERRRAMEAERQAQIEAIKAERTARLAEAARRARR